MIARSLAAILRFFIVGLRPLLGPALCNFTPGCTDFATEQLSTQPLLHAIKAITQRVLACNPFYNPYR